jgi:hypothetical protein
MKLEITRAPCTAAGVLHEMLRSVKGGAADWKVGLLGSQC